MKSLTIVISFDVSEQDRAGQHPGSGSKLGTAIWYHSGLSPAPVRWVLVRDLTGVRDPQAFLCTDLDATPVEILGWFVHRWSIETTFQESRAHLGVETQRQWSDLAIARTTPALFGLFSLVTLWAADPKINSSPIAVICLRAMKGKRQSPGNVPWSDSRLFVSGKGSDEEGEEAAPNVRARALNRSAYSAGACRKPSAPEDRLAGALQR